MEKFKNEIIDRLELPKDVLLQDSLIQITGSHEMTIGNLKGILNFTSEKIVLQTKQCQLLIEGRRLMIDFFTNDEMKITGKILKIEFGE
ncbi:MAG: sporulation protein [Eubacterium sp.]|nr:sporulation protein [Eubacterium sp.]